MEYMWEDGPDLRAISSSRSPLITYLPDLLHLVYCLSLSLIKGTLTRDCGGFFLFYILNYLSI